MEANATISEDLTRWVRLPELAVMLDESEANADRRTRTAGFPSCGQWVKGGIRSWDRAEVETWIGANLKAPVLAGSAASHIPDRRRGPRRAA